MDRKTKAALSNDQVFNAINKLFITLHDDKVKEANRHLHQVVQTLISIMKNVDTLFAKSYREIFFRGSFYKGTRVGSPTEFDLVVVIKLPIDYSKIQVLRGAPQCVRLCCQELISSDYRFERRKIIEYIPAKKQTSTNPYRILSRMLRNKYLEKNIFRQWVEGVLQKALNTLPYCNREYLLIVPGTGLKYRIAMRKSGPAFTLVVAHGDWHCDIDFVPSLEFNARIPCGGRASEVTQSNKETWVAVAKPFWNLNDDHSYSWVYSLYNKEQEILARYGRVKAVIRQMKKLRDTQGWYNLVSYHIEMLVINELENLEDVDLMPFTFLLFTMLQKLRDAFVANLLPYYWDISCNLLAKLGNTEVHNIAMRLNNIIHDVERKISSDKYALAKYILTKTELEQLKTYITFTPEPGQQSYCNIL